MWLTGSLLKTSMRKQSTEQLYCIRHQWLRWYGSSVGINPLHSFEMNAAQVLFYTMPMSTQELENKDLTILSFPDQYDYRKFTLENLIPIWSVLNEWIRNGNEFSRGGLHNIQRTWQDRNILFISFQKLYAHNFGRFLHSLWRTSRIAMIQWPQPSFSCALIDGKGTEYVVKSLKTSDPEGERLAAIDESIFVKQPDE